MAEARVVTPEEIAEAIQKLRFPKPKISSEEAAKKAVARYTEGPAMNHCAPSTIEILQEAYDLPGGELLPWIANGFRGGVLIGEICGVLSGAAMCLSLMAYKVLEPRTDHERRIAAYAVEPYMYDIAYAFHTKFGSIRCATLTGRLDRPPMEAEKYSRLRLWEAQCSPYVDFVVRTIVKWGEDAQLPPPPLPLFGPRLKFD